MPSTDFIRETSKGVKNINLSIACILSTIYFTSYYFISDFFFIFNL